MANDRTHQDTSLDWISGANTNLPPRTRTVGAFPRLDIIFFLVLNDARPPFRAQHSSNIFFGPVLFQRRSDQEAPKSDRDDFAAFASNQLNWTKFDRCLHELSSYKYADKMITDQTLERRTDPSSELTNQKLIRSQFRSESILPPRMPWVAFRHRREGSCENTDKLSQNSVKHNLVKIWLISRCQSE